MVSKTTKLEIAWTLAVVGLLAGVAVWSTFVLYQVDATANCNQAECVTVTAAQWSWTFCYANRTCVTPSYNPNTNTETNGGLWVTPGETVQLNITSTDVDHSLYIPGLGVQMNAIPGRTNRVAFSIPEVAPGTQYIIECTELCGSGHGSMRAFVVVV